MPTTDNVAQVFESGRILQVGDRNGRPAGPEMTLTVAGVRPFKGGLLVRFEHIRDRTGSELFRDRTLLIPAQEAEPLEPGEYFLHDLVGLDVHTTDGDVVGNVREIYPVGSGYLLAVFDGEREVMVPFSGRLVRSVALDEGTIVIDPPAGLLDL